MSRLLQFALPLALLAGACSTAPKSEEDKTSLRADVDAALMDFKNADATLQENFFEESAGYAVLPSIGKGGVGIGGAYGKGIVFEGGEAIGFCDMTQASIGFQLGGQSFAQIVFFKTEGALEKFTQGNFEFSAQVSAVAVTAGASGSTDYIGDMAVFTMTNGGLMYEASVAGQKFAYVEM